MKRILPFYLVVFIFSCTSTPEKPRPEDWQGNWKAVWETPPESYPGIEDVEFTMTGNFVFDADSLTVQANGFDGCIFHSDTLTHTQSWYVVKSVTSQDSLLVSFNDPGQVGLTYKINSKSADKIVLQMLDDIFITLSKQ